MNKKTKIKLNNAKILVSSCLLGHNCKYNGSHNENKAVMALKDRYELIPVCPELLGGLKVPRLSSELKGDKVINENEEDVTTFFEKGALLTLEIAQKNHCQVAILKAKSPSCGFGLIYDGTFSHHLITGVGITAKLLYQNGIVILNEDNFYEQID